MLQDKKKIGAVGIGEVRSAIWRERKVPRK
ncbi:hypothetical protein PanWU01x14_199630 [Parasponia andersonii]|uniref:Uncharacterized protein n=1 Tax=Parasponia andersonii TaxID=3476 RepID=A0A2P5BYF5_PARAD|nr:hypothetical protein PanWU01x14_199630 [Parasponia andersonii]